MGPARAPGGAVVSNDLAANYLVPGVYRHARHVVICGDETLRINTGANLVFDENLVLVIDGSGAIAIWSGAARSVRGNVASYRADHEPIGHGDEGFARGHAPVISEFKRMTNFAVLC